MIVKPSTSNTRANSRGSLLQSSQLQAKCSPTRAGVCYSQANYEQHTRQHERADSHRTACVPASCLRSSCMPGLVSRTRSCSRSAAVRPAPCHRSRCRSAAVWPVCAACNDQPPSSRPAPRTAFRSACVQTTNRSARHVPLGLRPDREPHGLRSRLPIDSGRQELSWANERRPRRVVLGRPGPRTEHARERAWNDQACFPRPIPGCPVHLRICASCMMAGQYLRW